jgi:hypothetical protein
MIVSRDGVLAILENSIQSIYLHVGRLGLLLVTLGGWSLRLLLSGDGRCGTISEAKNSIDGL